MGETLLRVWQALAPWPGGRRIFGFILGWRVPYTGSIGAMVMELRPGFVRVELADRRKVRNHLNCIHAVALMNLGEMATGLAVMTGLQPGARGIITNLSMEYFKKARGRLSATAQATPPVVAGDVEHVVQADIFDQGGECVARCHATWRLGLAP